MARSRYAEFYRADSWMTLTAHLNQSPVQRLL